MKNIWYFHHYATPVTMSGMSRPSSLGKHLQDKGHRITVFAASFLHYTGNNLISDSQTTYITNNDTEIPFVFVNTPSYKDSGKARIINMIKFFFGLKKTVKKYLKDHDKPDVIIASSPHPFTMIAGIRIAKKLGVPCICEVRDFWPEVFFLGGRLKESSILGRILLAGEKWIYKKADAIIFLKEGDSTYLIDRKWDKETHGGPVSLEKCFYINNGIDYKKFRENITTSAFSDPDLDNNKFKVIYAGAIRPVNNIGAILDCAKLLKDDTDISFIIYGDGNMLPSLKLRAENEGITNVVFKGYVSKSQIPYILSKASVNLLNYSGSEYNWSRGNSSNKMFEYLASGKPVISNVKMGYCILEKYRCGFTTGSSTPEALAETISMVKQLDEKQFDEISKNARAAAQDFDFSLLTEKLLHVIEYAADAQHGNGHK